MRLYAVVGGGDPEAIDVFLTARRGPLNVAAVTLPTEASPTSQIRKETDSGRIRSFFSPP